MIRIFKRFNSTDRITPIVDSIAELNLLETANLVAALKTRLNIADIAVAAPQPAAPVAAQQEPVKEQTQFKITLSKFEAASKAKIIKEIKALLPGANLVEKFVESAPKVVKEGLSKEEAEKIKKVLESVGATVTMD